MSKWAAVNQSDTVNFTTYVGDDANTFCNAADAADTLDSSGFTTLGSGTDLQKNNPEFITEMMDESGLIYHPNSMDIKREDLKESLLALKKYVKSKDKLWYTIIDESEINEEWVNENLLNLKFN